MWNVCGNPAASLPVGFARSGLPIGVQLVGRLHDDPTLMALAAQVEQARGWTDHWPP
ncbi:amidase family protein [Nocardia carnea]|nr:amidase family protein [Nocardia carnea]